MSQVFLAAGSNQDAPRNLLRALRELARRFGPLEVSTAYRNAAVGFEGPDFINLAVGFDTDRGLHEVIEELRQIEALCGRRRDAPKWASRPMDLDILLFADLIHEAPGVTLPRPCLLTQAYMLGPMAQIAPQLRHPVAGKTLAELWEAFDRAAHPLTPVASTPAELPGQ
jgi:2-amino-4-hydroxy-6-hydroxymethyldihydropteridine diphosphokinase